MHPFDNFHFMPELMVSSLKFVHRFETLCLWRSWAQELKTEEKSLHATLRSWSREGGGQQEDPLDGKDRGSDWLGGQRVVFLLEESFSLTGNQEKTGIFPDDFKPPTSREVGELMDRAKFVKFALWGKIRNEAVQSFSQELWDIAGG